jgi:hypothetical protein
VTTPDYSMAVIYALGNDGKIHTKSTNATGTTWGSWSTLSLDASMLDARSDIDCSANSSVTHITATGNNPLGAFMHSEGSGTTFNPFFRELSEVMDTFPGASVKAYPQGVNYVIGGMNSGIPDLYEVDNGVYTSLQPDSWGGNASIFSPIDVSASACCGGAARMLAGFDNYQNFEIITNFISSAPMTWTAPVVMAPPAGSFQYSPTVCVDTGSMGGSQVHVAAVANGAVYDSYATSSSQGPFTGWAKIASAASGPVDCTMMGDETVHVVTLTSAGHVLDIHGTGGGTWSTTDLGAF